MSRHIERSLLEFIENNPFSTIYEIKFSGIIKNYSFLKKYLDTLEQKNKVKYLKYCGKYYIQPLPSNLVIIGMINEYADKIHSQLKTNQNIQQGQFYQYLQQSYKKVQKFNGTKHFKARKLPDMLFSGAEKIKRQNERCLLKWFLLYVQKAIIWELEIRKLKLQFIHINDEKLFHSILMHMMQFDNFLQNYDPKNSKSILSVSYSNLEKVLDTKYSDDLEYYDTIKYNKNSISYKIKIFYDYLLYNDKECIKWFSRSEIMNNKKKEIISESNSQHSIKCEKLSLNSSRNNAKNTTSIINTICNKNGLPDIEKILHEDKIEHNRLLYENVDYNDPERLVRLFLIRSRINQYPRHEQIYKDMVKLLKKKLPEFVIP